MKALPACPVTLVVLFLLLFIHHSSPIGMDDPDYDRDTCELIVSRGFKCRLYFPVTKDGYILSLYRIVNPYVTNRRRPVLLQHGLFGSSADFIIAAYDGHARAPESLSKEKKRNGNLGFELANHGYDVWLGNFRGNWYSMNHTRLSSRDKKFWDFNFDHHAEHDLPAMTGFILKKTGRGSIGYFGHSMGGFAMMALLASRPEMYSHVFKPAIAASSSIRLTNTRSNGFVAGATIPFFDSLLTALGGPFPPPIPHQTFLTNLLCQGLIRDVCRSVFLNVGALDTTNQNQSRFHVMLNHFPQTTSAATFVGMIQSVKGTRFNKFDYGPDGNLHAYGTESVPYYRLQNIRSPYLAMFYSKGDDICVMEDVQWAISQLRVRLLDNYLIPKDDFSHHDMMWAKDAPRLVFDRVLSLLEKTM